ncbi:DMT family transporter [Clostridium tertium]|jgi:drug/metabolite transporter (DMT)-like permease|uniref:DMT family transporter n=1 Tax=Clostridium tertium TaxID=1559 RepID=UPI000C06F781|nr:DMT family transporter [Clostridium tertium]MBU6135580.1 DMT family transporter [Clostridium tertium]MDB1942352.1 DMT family transporter [Clostridium tertium]MDI9215455.1 DMT family transporter [Clostridium tertium]MDY4603773.1 DMT family transporter [Clostridium tertium]
MNNLSNRTKGILFLVFSAFGFAVMSAFVKLAGDLPSFQKTFFRNLVSCIVALFFIIKNKESFFGKKENQKVLLLRSALGTVGIVLNFYSIDKLVLSDANMLNKLSPFFVIIFSALFLSEKINFKQFIAIIIAFVGALFIIKPSFNLDMIPAFMGILGAIFAAGAYTCLRVLGGREKHYTIVFYFSLFSLVVIFPFMMAVYTPMSIKQSFYLLMAGLFASIGQFGITIAYKYAPAKEISIFDYSNILFSAMISFLVFGVLPDTLSFIGYFIIFASSYYMYIYNQKLDKAEGK